jgi:predicted phage gp36 major capsid-like protein
MEERNVTKRPTAVMDKDADKQANSKSGEVSPDAESCEDQSNSEDQGINRSESATRRLSEMGIFQGM